MSFGEAGSVTPESQVTSEIAEINFVTRLLQGLLLFLSLGYRVTCIEDDAKSTIWSDGQAEMVHEQTLRPALIEVGAGLPEERIDSELEVKLLGPKLCGILDKRRFTPVSLALSLALARVCGIGVVGSITAVLVTTSVGEVAEELAGLGTDRVDTGRPDLDAAIKGAGGALEIDGVVGVVA